MRDAINSGTEFRGMVTNYSRTGTLLYNNLVMTPVKNKDGTVTHFTGIQVGTWSCRFFDDVMRTSFDV
jgi:hypothetical protein